MSAAQVTTLQRCGGSMNLASDWIVCVGTSTHHRLCGFVIVIRSPLCRCFGFVRPLA